MMTMVLDGLDLELFFTVDYLWWGFRKVDPMLLGFTIRSQQTGVEYVMDSPGRRKLELISDW
jgi:hypothetical protein